LADRDLVLPPRHLRERVGCLPVDQDSAEAYLAFGKACSEIFIRSVPQDWDWAGKKVLDFGAGAGRTLRHFQEFAAIAEFIGCDIDAESVEWAQHHLQPEFTFFLNSPSPPTTFEDNSFDLIYCFSVFSHLSTNWAEWLIELKRILKPGGLLLATFMGEGMSERITGEPWNENRVGMSTFKTGQTWDHGGPMVMLSPWWIMDHWGRCLDVKKIIPRDFFNGNPIGGVHDHGLIVAQKNDDTRQTVDELRLVNLANPRELAALEYKASHLEKEAMELWDLLNWRNDQIRQIEVHFGDVVPFIFAINTAGAQGKLSFSSLTNSATGDEQPVLTMLEREKLLDDLRVERERLTSLVASETQCVDFAEGQLANNTINTKTFRWTRLLRYLYSRLR
jgi:SAM-dependent methyltransferase